MKKRVEIKQYLRVIKRDYADDETISKLIDDLEIALVELAKEIDYLNDRLRMVVENFSEDDLEAVEYYLVSYPIRVRFLPPDLLTITSSYDESDKLILYIRNLGEHKISPKVRIVFPNEVSFKFKGVEFKKNEFTEEDYLKITGKKLEIEPDHEKRLVFHPVYEGRSVRDYGVTTIIVETEGLIIGKDLKTRLLGQSTKTQRQKE